MINVTVSNNMKRKQDLFSKDTTLRECLESCDIDYSRGILHIDSAPINPGDLDRTFEQLGYDGSEGHNRCFVAAIVKADNA